MMQQTRKKRITKVLRVEEIKTEQALAIAFDIRKRVFVEEQKVPLEEEIDEYEDISTHLLAYADNQRGIGTCRWRLTEKGIKLERFAVLQEFRGQGIGHQLVQACLDSIRALYPEAPLCYLHAQIQAVPLYEAFGFHKKGEPFDECGIMHYEMELA
jgi:predicted GNAT family N-acyltransferase